MKIRCPLEITPRLQAGFRLGAGPNISWVSIQREQSQDFRDRFSYAIDLPGGFSHEAADLASGIGGCTLQGALVTLLSFFSAAADAYRYTQAGGDSDNSDLFPPEIMEWASDNDDALQDIQAYLEDTPNMIEE